MRHSIIGMIILISCVTFSALAETRYVRGARRFTKPTAILSANPAAIVEGESSTLSWVTHNSTSVTLGSKKQWYTYNDPLQVPLNGFMLVTPDETTTYYLLVRNRRFDLNNNSRGDGIRRSTWAAVTVTVNEGE